MHTNATIRTAIFYQNIGDDTFTLYDIKRTNEVLEWINQMFIKPNNSTNSSKNI